MPLRVLIGVLILASLALPSQAEFRIFRNAEGTKSFAAELTSYDAKTKVVSVRAKNGRIQNFTLELLSEKDQAYVLKNATRLAVGAKLDLTLASFKDSSRKERKDRITDRIYPSGYTINLRNRSKNAFEGVTLNYTLHYEVQDYLNPERKPESKTGTIDCGTIVPLANITLRTDTVDIVSGKLEPVITNQIRRTATGEDYVEPVVTSPGGKRKDLLVGCRVDVIVDGQVVKSVTDGTLAVESKNP